MSELPGKLQSRPFTSNQAAGLGLSFYELSKLVESGAVEQVARGIYRVAGGDIDEEEQLRIATLRVGVPSTVCLTSALVHHHLTDAVPKKIWIMVPVNKRTTDKTLKLLRTRQPRWKIGVEKHEGYSVTNIERTLVDCLTNRSKLGTQVGIAALRAALESKKTTLGKVVDMANQLGVTHRILFYIEALS